MFRAKKDLWLTVTITAILSMGLLPLITDILKRSYENVIFACIFAGVLFLFAALFFDIRYEFKEEYICIKTGPVREKLYYKNIVGIKSENPRFGDLSVKRFRIYYNGMPKNIVFPKDYAEFIKELEKRVPDLIKEI